LSGTSVPGTAPSGERLDVQSQPRLDLLIEHDAREHPARVREHEHEHPRLAKLADRRVVELPDVSEVDLCDIAGVGLDRDRDVVGVDAAPFSPAPPDCAHGVVAAREVGIVELEAIVDRLRRQPRIRKLDDPRFPVGDRRGHLRRQTLRQLLLHRVLEDVELG
jgi:hypothetical protein